MRVFISGGCKNGKSTFAQRTAKILAGAKPLYYIATMEPHDQEDLDRIERHLKEREGWGFETIECGRGILDCLTKSEAKGSYLLDSVTALLSNEMFQMDGTMDFSSPQRVAGELISLSRQVDNIVFVSDYIYSDAHIYDEITEKYRQGLSYIDKALARECECVIEVCGANIIYHKGEPVL
jgi:adenosylcobinamide kinase/adenosylcobinamide-phosphate guanylyltransferase